MGGLRVPWLKVSSSSEVIQRGTAVLKSKKTGLIELTSIDSPH